MKSLGCVSHHRVNSVNFDSLTSIVKYRSVFSNSLEFDITKIYSIYCLHTLWGSVLAEPGISFRFR